MTTPTKETHRYVGMWRPPFEEVLAQTKDATSGSLCRCDQGFWTVGSLTYAPDRQKVLTCWLAGHFDEPVYELKIDWNKVAPGFMRQMLDAAESQDPRNCCPICHHQFEMGEPPHFKPEESGEGHDGERTVHWVLGTQTCPECGATWQYGDSD